MLNGSTIIVSEQKKDVLKKIKKNILSNSSKKIIFGEDYNYKKDISGFIYRDKIGKINLPFPNLLGDFQISNISTAIAAARNLEQFKINESHIKKAITKIRSEGRLQQITQGKLRKYVSVNNQIIIDGAHIPLGASAIKNIFPTNKASLNLSLSLKLSIMFRSICQI